MILQYIDGTQKSQDNNQSSICSWWDLDQKQHNSFKVVDVKMLQDMLQGHDQGQIELELDQRLI